MNGPQPTLEASRLILRPFLDADAPAIARVCASREVAMMTRTIPHPYTLDDARAFLSKISGAWQEGSAAVFAICEKSSGELVGSIGLAIDPHDIRAELGYSLAVPHWGKGYASEAALEIIRLGFSDLGLRKITAHYMPRNPASGRVLEKAGFIIEGHLRVQAFKWGEAFDLIAVGLLRSEWQARFGIHPSEQTARATELI